MTNTLGHFRVSGETRWIQGGQVNPVIIKMKYPIKTSLHYVYRSYVIYELFNMNVIKST